MTTSGISLLYPTVGTTATSSLFSRAPSAFARTASLTFPRRRPRISCEVALTQSDAPSSSSSSSSSAADASEDAIGDKVGARVRVKVPLKVYHVQRVGEEVELEGMEGVIKQFVGVWKGKRVSANLPYKVEFVKGVEGRGEVKFFAHLKEDEFEFI